MISINADKYLTIKITVESMNISNSDAIMKELKKAALDYSEKEIVIDMTNVSYIDSSAIAMLVNFTQSLAGSRRQMSIINTAENIKNSIKVLNLTKFLNIK